MSYGYSFFLYIKTGDIYKGIPEDVEKRLDTHYELDSLLPKKKKVIVLIKNEFG